MVYSKRNMTSFFLGFGTRFWVLIAAASFLFAFPSAENAKGEEGVNEALYLANAGKNLPLLRQELLKSLDDSRQCDPVLFANVVKDVATAGAASINDNLKPIEMSGVRKASYATYNMDIWRFRALSANLHQLALAYTLPESPLAGSPEIAAKAAAGFEWVLNVVTPQGTCNAPDTNIDRFAYVECWDAFVLFAPALSEDLQNRFLKHLLAAADYQLTTYGRRAFPFGGGYPNMDAAYLLVMEQGTRLFGKEAYTADVDLRVRQLQDRIAGSTWEYLAGWNPQANYTLVTLKFIGRFYQLSKNPEALKQIQGHADYYTYYIEPNGLLDYGMTPFIKHDWVQVPYNACGPALEMVNRYAPTPTLQNEVNRMREVVKTKSDASYLYFLSKDSGKQAAPPAAFVRSAPEIVGFQARTLENGSTLTAYGTGKKIAVDTRVSAMVSGKGGKGDAILAGVFLELIQGNTSYYLGEMAPQVDLQTTDTSASLAVVQGRRMMGPNSKPLVQGNHHDDIKNWKFDCWKGGSPSGPPIETKENWTWKKDRLTGVITLTAQEETKLDGAKITLPFLLASLNETALLPHGRAFRVGNMCIAVQGRDDQWAYPKEENPFDFRADVPPGEYVVTMTSGAANVRTDPFDVFANGKKVADSVTAESGTSAECTFKTTDNKGAILLQFQPRTGGNHWKVGALTITSADGKSYAKKFAVGGQDQPSAPGVQRIAGADVYTPERGYGWSRDLTNNERHLTSGSGAIADFITSSRDAARLVFSLGKQESWAKGKTAQFQITIGVGDSLASWLAAGAEGKAKATSQH